jgi:hypothetical protein
VFLFVSLFPDNHLLAPGCTQYLGGSPITHSLLITDLAGHAQTPLAIPSSTLFEGLPLHWQGLQLVVGGPVFGAATLSNGIKMRVSCR